MQKVFSNSVTGFVFALLAACGGGGGSSATVAPPPAQVAPVEIASANAATVASDSLWASAFFGADIGTLTGIASSGSQPGATIFPRLSKLTESGIYKMASPVLEATMGPMTEDCMMGGTATLTMTYTDLLTITAGDSISMDFVNCDDGDGQIMDGFMQMTFTAFSGDIDTGLFQTTVVVTVDNLSSDDGSLLGPAVVDGGFTMMLNTLALPVTSTNISGDLLSVTVAARHLTMVDFTSTQISDQGVFPTAYEVTANGMVRSNRFDGEAECETITPFSSSGVEFPYAGEMVITGANGATITVIVLDNQMVRLIMDYNGDGVEDERRDVPWDEAIG